MGLDSLEMMLSTREEACFGFLEVEVLPEGDGLETLLLLDGVKELSPLPRGSMGEALRLCDEERPVREVFEEDREACLLDDEEEVDLC